MNEDVLLVSGATYGVFDGATSLVPAHLPKGQTGGYLAARIAADTFGESSVSLRFSAIEANARIGQAVRVATTSLDRDALWSTSMAVIRIDGNRIEYCQSGDAVVLLLLKGGGYRCIGSDIDIDRETLLMWKRLEWREGVSIYSALADQIRKTRQGMNRDYGVLNGEPEAISFLKYGEVERDEVADVLLFTDGLFLPKEDPSESTDWQAMVQLYKAVGLHGVHREVRRLQEADPHCRKYPRFKQHDDVAALALSF